MKSDSTGRCECEERHLRRRIVLTGGPGAGKTAVLEAIKHSLCSHVTVLAESAGILFGGGFPRIDSIGARRAAQRAIFHVQRELEGVADDEDFAIVLCDRGLVDSMAYWPGPGDFWSEVGMTREHALARYDAVIHLRVPDTLHGYGRGNPLRIESAEEAAAIDGRILDAWAGHPHRHIVAATSDFVAKVSRVLALVRQDLPRCCRNHLVPPEPMPQLAARGSA
jgi:predicted ATPase